MDTIQDILQTIESAERQRDNGHNNDRAAFLLQLATAKSLSVIAQAAAMWMGENEQIAKLILDKAQSVASVTGIPNADEELTKEAPAESDMDEEHPVKIDTTPAGLHRDSRYE